ncbi:acyltransferase [Pseudoclavibacter chungangensis]|uniref:Acyltransferase n=1 Tax=Pseudoclavibacter chungangensis TaxID=587635 RepID=A0A7J5C0U3_9MICO|nr:acyltransferase [Pseudoclavibacter chungangensis]KAB1659430.1 acyltransferase [Pseudoclavibacter chungangensis]NYJ67722.1 glucan biosynthesis protein C [Pseudoclavibacter chungangensis]
MSEHPVPPGATAPSTVRTSRIHGLDAVRAGALLLGILLHALMPFTIGMPWLVSDTTQATWPLAVISIIHLFRMSLFLVIAGYFANRSRARHGTRAFLRDRGLRVTLPPFVFWPVAVLPLGLIAQAHADATGASLVRPAHDGGLLAAFDLGHLWFLWVLTQCILVAVVARAILVRVAPRWSARAAARCTRVLTSPWGVLVAALPSVATLLVQGDPSGVVAPSTLVPDPVALCSYLGAFVVGWLLASDGRALERLATYTWQNVAVALVALPTALVVTGVVGDVGVLPVYVWAPVCAIAAWATVYALIGGAVRFLRRERRWIRLLADASYWMYLMHLVVLVGLEAFVADLPLPLGVKLLGTLTVTTVVLLATYRWLVRPTWIGRWLNGTGARSRHRDRAHR